MQWFARIEYDLIGRGMLSREKIVHTYDITETWDRPYGEGKRAKERHMLGRPTVRGASP